MRSTCRRASRAHATPDARVRSAVCGRYCRARAATSCTWEEDGKGNRDFEVGDVDSNRQQFDDLAHKLAERIDERTRALIDATGETENPVAAALETLRDELSDALPTDLHAGGLKDLTEFGRAMHAEMTALLDATRRGVPVQGATLFTTTFPCHNCARHIIGAGIDRVVFIEPYTKSHADQLHADSVTIAQAQRETGKVAFVPFVGVAPRRYREMFDAATREQLGHLARKDDAGRKQVFDKSTALPVFSDCGLAQFRPEAREYRAKELLALEHFDKHHGQPEPSVRSDQEAS